MECPKCRYQRQAADHVVPDWQCPACGIAYAKALSSQLHSPVTASELARISNRHGQRSWLDHLLTLFMALSLIAFGLAWSQKDRLPDHSTLASQVDQEPLQTRTSSTPFNFQYRGEDYWIEPVADYELWGMVVTHNNITGITDIMHTKDSVDIKDICVLWGSNTRNNDYQRMNFSSGDFICYYQYPYGVSFQSDEISNNHLLSDNEKIREAIRQTHIGDQIHLRGMLINYSWKSHPGWMRRTSTTRQDTGNGACEVVFVSDFEILRTPNHVWHTLFTISPWLIILSVVLKLVSFALPAQRQ